MKQDPLFVPEVGTLCRDAAGRIGVFMGTDAAGRLYLRPRGGGIEWPVRPEEVSPVTTSESLSAAVTELNKLSRWGL